MGNLVRVFAVMCTAFSVLISAGCGGANPSTTTGGPLSGNWQLNLVQNYPTPQTQLSASGFIVESSSALTGSVQGPTTLSSNGTHNCGGVGPLTGTISGQDVTFSLNPGGTTFTFTGTISSDNTSMSGSYEAAGVGCYVQPGTTGTWTASLIPPLNGNFTGALTNSTYMSLLTGQTPPPPISVSGTINQSTNAGASNASLTGTISAVGYPCFVTASLTGTVSGQSVNLSVFGYNGEQIGTLTSAVAAPGSSGPTINGTLTLGETTATTVVGPCPPLNTGSQTFITDSTLAALAIQ